MSNISNEVCNCMCHSMGGRHIINCCAVCSICGLRIKRIGYVEHFKVCKEKEKELKNKFLLMETLPCNNPLQCVDIEPDITLNRCKLCMLIAIEANRDKDIDNR